MKNFDIKRFIMSFTDASRGIKIFFQDEQNAKVHLLCAIVVILLGFLFEISKYEWIAVIISICSVIGFEILNTAIEKLCDYVSAKEYNPTIKKVKDLSASAVLFVSISALIIGLIIFLPKLIGFIFK